ncbi:MAG: PEP-CTERM sorting domain-containing protein [Acidobacteria bacterium]|nr:PEP-CTERM sorting domain-containing protein [Acidobacteriota bacterium]
MRKLFLLLVLISAATSNIYGGTLFVSGDINLVPGVSAPEPNDNDVFLANILGGRTNVMLLDSSLGSLGNIPLTSFYSGQGATVTSLPGAVTGVALTGIDLFIAVLPDDAFSAGEIAAISGFLSGGGTVFLVGDNNAPLFATANSAINGLLAGLGSGMSIVPDNLDPASPFLSQVEPDPFTAGITTFYHTSSSQVSGGTVLFRGAVDSGSKAIVAYETLGDVPEPATWVLLGVGALAMMLRRQRIG